jgi:hypothetical protein
MNRIGFQVSTNTREVAALLTMGVKALDPKQTGEPSVARVFTEVSPYDPKTPDGGGHLQWMIGLESTLGTTTKTLRESWKNGDAAEVELNAFVDSLEPDIKAILRRLIPCAMMSVLRDGFHNWTQLGDVAKKAAKKIAYNSGGRTNVFDLDYSKGVADKFGLPYPNPAMKQKR